MNTHTLGETLMLARRRAGLSQAFIANALGVSGAFLSAVERGKKRLPAHHLPLLPQAVRRDVAEALIEGCYHEIVELQALRDA
jgi:transcriptional regulator with XRE-family HTH domain